MSKDKKNGNRESRKPKQKTGAAAPATTTAAKGMPLPAGLAVSKRRSVTK